MWIALAAGSPPAAEGADRRSDPSDCPVNVQDRTDCDGCLPALTTPDSLLPMLTTAYSSLPILTGVNSHKAFLDNPLRVSCAQKREVFFVGRATGLLAQSPAQSRGLNLQIPISNFQLFAAFGRDTGSWFLVPSSRFRRRRSDSALYPYSRPTGFARAKR